MTSRHCDFRVSTGLLRGISERKTSLFIMIISLLLLGNSVAVLFPGPVWSQETAPATTEASQPAAAPAAPASGAPAPAEAPKGGGLNIVKLYQSMGGPALVVFWVLVCLSIWSLFVAVDRFTLYNSARNQSMQFIKVAKPLLEKGKVSELIKITKRFPKSHLARIYSVVCYSLTQYQEMQNTGDAKLNDEQLATMLNRDVSREAFLVTAELKKRLSGIATIGATAPFIGLFGTVIGVINAFTGIAAAGAGGLGEVSGGIAEALIETAIGLFVAIPAVWFFNYFINQVSRFTVEMENSGSELVDYFIRKGMRI
jgi:biopolymer transport protein ExbB/TolQ